MERVHQVVLSHLDFDGEGTLLEVGCGSGALSIRAALLWPEAQVTGIDYWGAAYGYGQAMCEKNAASEGVAARCRFQRGDANKLDFPDESFDAVVSNYVYHNVVGADKRALLLETLRVLKKGGVFALNDDMKPRMYGDMEAFAQELRDMGYSDVRLIDTAQEAFGSHGRAAAMMLWRVPDARGSEVRGRPMTLAEFRRTYPAATYTVISGKPFVYRYYKNPQGQGHAGAAHRRYRAFRPVLPALCPVRPGLLGADL